MVKEFWEKYDNSITLNAFADFIDTLREKIALHSEILSRNEYAVRRVLVEPLLEWLGWEVDNPEEVEPEAALGRGGRADYLLKINNKPVAVIEVKKL